MCLNPGTDTCEARLAGHEELRHVPGPGLASQVDQVIGRQSEPTDHQAPVHLGLVFGYDHLYKVVDLLGVQCQCLGAGSDHPIACFIVSPISVSVDHIIADLVRNAS